MAMDKRNRKTSSKQVLSVTRRDRVFVGLDVHKRSIHAAIRINGSLAKTQVLAASSMGVCNWLEPYRKGLRLVVYEAGPTGYGLVRELRQHGFAADVIAPAKLLRPAGMESKSDALDCRRLAEMAEKGLLSGIAIPDEQAEAHRQIFRLREQVICKIRRVKQQIRSFLLMYSIKEPEGLQRWTKASLMVLRELAMVQELRFSLDILLDELDRLKQQLKEINIYIESLASSEAYAERVSRLRTHPGVGVLTALMFQCELCDPARFENKRQLACYLGLAPQVRQSGEIRREGPTIKAGQGTLRSKLVEASWVWLRVDEAAARTYGRLCRNTGSGKKAIVGMARRMAVNLWSMTVKNEPYRQAV